MPDVFVPPTVNESATISPSVPPSPGVSLIARLPFKNPTPRPMGAFTTYVEMPKNVIFDTQHEEETILLFLRKDFITNVPWIVATILLLLIPTVLKFILGLTDDPFAFFPVHFTVILRALYYVLVATYIFVSFITWFFNISLVTTERVLDIDFSDVVYKNVSATKIKEIEDVSFTQTGVIRTLFDYGDVLVQTAGTIDNFDFTAVPRPNRVVEVIEAILGGEKSGE